jgi:CrcB protein
MLWEKILLVFIGGGLGSLSRYGTTVLSARMFGTHFPWGTLIVNSVGCFLIGIAVALAEHNHPASHISRLFIMVGFLGGFTTFSTFGLETMNAARAGAYLPMLLNMLANNAGGLFMVGLGMLGVRVFVK